MYTYLMSFWRTLYAHFTCQNNKTTFLRLTVFKIFQLSDYSFIQKEISFFYRLLPKCQKQIPIPKPRLQTKPLLATVFRNFINRKSVYFICLLVLIVRAVTISGICRNAMNN